MAVAVEVTGRQRPPKLVARLGRSGNPRPKTYLGKIREPAPGSPEDMYQPGILFVSDEPQILEGHADYEVGEGVVVEIARSERGAKAVTISERVANRG